MPTLPPKIPLITEMKLEAAHVGQINKVLTMSANKLDQDIKKVGKKGNPLSRMQLEAQRAAIKAQLDQDWTNIEHAIAAGKVEAVKAASAVVSQYESTVLGQILSPEAMRAIARSEANRAALGMDAMLKRVGGPSYVPLSKSVYKNKSLVTGWVDLRINQALLSGWTSDRLAREIRNFIDPNVPGGVSYAANRLARTEINNAFHASAITRYQESGIVDAVDWNLSSSHPEGDICDDYAHDSPYDVKNVPRKPHPHCYCFITPALPDEEEFLNNLLDGKYGDEPWKPALTNDPNLTAVQAATQLGLKNYMKDNIAPLGYDDYKAAMSKINPQALAQIASKLDPDDLKYLSEIAPKSFQKLIIQTTVDDVDDAVKAIKASAVNHAEVQKKMTDFAMHTGKAPTYNELAKTYKIKASVLEDTGIPVAKLDEILSKYTPAQLTKIKKLAKNSDQSEYIYLQQVPTDDFLALHGKPFGAKKPKAVPKSMDNEFDKPDSSLTWLDVEEDFGVPAKYLAESGATPKQMWVYLDSFDPEDVVGWGGMDSLALKNQLYPAKFVAHSAVKKVFPDTTPPIGGVGGITGKVDDIVDELGDIPKIPGKTPGVPSVSEEAMRAKWLDKPAPVKPTAPKAPTPVGAKAYDDFIAASKARYKEFSGGKDLTKSNNWHYFQKVVNDNDLNALNYLKVNQYIDDDMYQMAIKASQQAVKVPKTAALKFTEESAAWAKAAGQYDVDIVEWRKANGITSAAKGFDDALKHNTNSAGTAWAKKNMKLAEGESRAALQEYTGGSYRSWNKALRAHADNSTVPEGTWADYTRRMDAGFLPTPEDVVVHRASNFDEFILPNQASRSGYWPPPDPSEMIGTVQTNYGYTSTSVGSNSAFSGEVWMQIMLPQGHPSAYVDPYSRNKGERELILPRGTQLFIHDVYQEHGPRGSRWTVKAEVVPIGEDPSGWTPISSR